MTSSADRRSMTSSPQPDTTIAPGQSETAETAEHARRMDALRDLQNLARDGGLDMDVLLDKRHYRGGPPA
ncbi:hypothetical protein YW5DRAFT_04941 [Streptomyces sp. Ncost-T6T-1]|nr:hypothetical protein YW5DRAFT_04941 [Streptomyces sp. Ncost-T6T-1]